MSDPINIKTQSDPLITALLARGFFYEFISNLFRHPKNTQAQKDMKYYQSSLISLLQYLDISQKEKLRELFKKLTYDLEHVSQADWIDQYEYYFGHTALGRVPAYENEYGEEHSYRQPHELSDIASFYHAFGLQINSKTHERVDHVSVECEFMALLIYKEVYALEQNEQEHAEICRNAAHRFLSEHLGRWLPAFTARLLRKTQKGIMHSIAEVASTFIAKDCETIGIDSGRLDLHIREIDTVQDSGCVSCSVKEVCRPQ